MTNETPPFTLTGWMLNRAADRAELVFTYLDKLKRAKNMQGRMLVHAEFLTTQMGKYDNHIKTASDALQMTQTLVGAVVQIFRHKENIEEMAQGNEPPTLSKPTTKKLTTEQRLLAIEKLLADK